ncbi:MAG: cytochrome P450 [Chloroflexi bacterium]|nr:cytochrome P450 [Chloroflexota bacterium]
MTDRARLFPLGDRIRLDQLARDPYPHYRLLQQREPVSWVGETQQWFVTRRADVLEVLYDAETYTVASPQSLLSDTLGEMMLSLDGAEHRRQRAPFAEAYQPRRLRRLHSDGIRDLVGRLIASFAARGEGELMSEFCDPLAIISVTGVLGLPLSDLDQILVWYDDIAAALANFKRDETVRARGQAAVRAFGAEIHAHLQRLAIEPDESALCAIAQHPQHPLEEEAIVANTILTIFGGRETTAAMLGNTIWAFLQHPQPLAELRADGSLLPNALEESLRWEAPVQTATRHVTQPTTLQGVALERGEVLQCILAAANRDPEHFPAAERFDIHRANAADHLSFAIGPHYCLGAPLARLEGQLGLSALLEALPNLRLREDAEAATLAHPYGHEFRGPRALHCCWDPAD